MRKWKRKTKDGKEIINFHPQEMRDRCIEKLQTGVNKITKKELTEKEKGFAAGYVAAGNDSAAAYKNRSEVNKRKEKEQFYNDLWK